MKNTKNVNIVLILKFYIFIGKIEHEEGDFSFKIEQKVTYLNHSILTSSVQIPRIYVIFIYFHQIS